MDVDGNPEGLRLTSHELHYLLALERSSTADENRRVLGLAGLQGDESAFDAGAAGLLSRGLAEVRGGLLVLGPAAGLVGYLLATATPEAQIGFVSRSSRTVAVNLVGAGFAMVLSRRQIGVFDIVVARTADSARDVVTPTLSAFLDAAEDSMVVIRRTPESGGQSALVLRTDGSRWRLARNVPRLSQLSLMEEADLQDCDRVAALRGLIDVVAA